MVKKKTKSKGKLPKNTPVGKVITHKGRKYKRIAMKGFPQWKFV